MFGLSAGELILVFIIALVLLGPEKIPEVARWLGKTSADLKRVSDGFRREFYNSVYVPPPEQGGNGNRTLTGAKEGTTPTTDPAAPPAESASAASISIPATPITPATTTESPTPTEPPVTPHH